MENTKLHDALINNYTNGSGCLSKEQVGGSLFVQWTSLIDVLYSTSRTILNQDWSTLDERQKHLEQAGMFDIIHAIYDIIGKVNGHKLRKPLNLDMLILGYTKANLKSKDGFRHLFEKLIARELIIQNMKSSEIFADEEMDKKLVRKVSRLKTYQRKRREERIAQQEQKNDEKPLPMAIEFTSFVVLCNIFMCNKNHSVEPIRAVVDTIDKLGEKHSIEISAGYCKECNVYFILESDFKRIRSTGILLCQLIPYEYYQKSTITLNGIELKVESVLHQSGYNVSAADDLTSAQRQAILRRVIDNNLYSINGLLSFLDWLIDRNKKITSKDMTSAIAKWNEDRRFVESYRTDSQRRIGIESLSYKK